MLYIYTIYAITEQLQSAMYSGETELSVSLYTVEPRLAPRPDVWARFVVPAWRHFFPAHDVHKQHDVFVYFWFIASASE